MVSPQRRKDIIDALRSGTVPQRGLDLLAVGMDRFEAAIDEDLATVKKGAARFKAVRGEYGSGKTFFARWVEERAKRMGFAVSEVQISETETPLHRLETIYRRLMERLSTADRDQGAFRAVIDAWVYALEEDLLNSGTVSGNDSSALLARTNELIEKRLSGIADLAPAFSAALRGYRTAYAGGDVATAESLVSWVSGQPNVAAAAKRSAGIKGDIDHSSALSFLQGLLIVLRDAGYSGLVIVLDEVETLQRMRSDIREKSLNALRQLIDELHGGRFPGLYLVITGTPAFFDGPQGVQKLPPLAGRLHTDFQSDPRFDNPRAPQVRLRNFDLDQLVEVGRKVRDLFAEGASNAERLRRTADDSYIALLAKALTGRLGGSVGIAPRLFLKKLVGDVLDRIDLYPEFDPRRDYSLTVADAEMREQERAVATVDDIDLNL